MYETSKFNPNIGENNMPKHNNNLINQIMEDELREARLKSEHKSLYEEMYWDDKMWADAWDKRFYDEYVKDTKNDLKQIKQTIFQMQSLINLIEKDIKKLEDKNDAIS